MFRLCRTSDWGLMILNVPISIVRLICQVQAPDLKCLLKSLARSEKITVVFIHQLECTATAPGNAG